MSSDGMEDTTQREENPRGRTSWVHLPKKPGPHREPGAEGLGNEGGAALQPKAATLPQLSQNPFFIGPHGLRAGWGCLLFLVLLAGFGYFANIAAGLLFRHLHPVVRGTPIAPRFLLISEGVEVLTVLLATLAMARFEGRHLRAFGLAMASAWPRAAGGFASGYVAISALVGTLWASHLLVLHGPVLPAAQALRFGLLWAVGFALVGCFEELLLRGYLLFTLARGIRFWPAAVVLSVLFGFIHRTNPGETPVGLFSAAAVGLLFCLSVWYTGSLWWAIGFHAAWDWGESFFWSTSDSGLIVRGHLLAEHPMGNLLLSGGATGPEGSLLIFPVLLACAVVMGLYWHRRRGPVGGIVDQHLVKQPAEELRS